MSTVGERIRAARKAKGMTQRELGERTGYTSRSTIAKIEAGVNDIPRSQVAAFAEALGCTVAYLMELVEPPDDVGVKPINERIREARKARGMTQRELGERSGIAEPTVRKYEAGQLNPKIETLQKLASALEMPVCALCCGGACAGEEKREKVRWK